MTKKTTPLNLESLAALASAGQPPCLSLYQPTHRRHPENKQDRIRFRNLVKEMEASLRQTYPALEAQQLLKPFEELAQDHSFWDHTQDGLAVLAGPLLFRVFSLPIPVEELVVVANSFHTKPLRRLLQPPILAALPEHHHLFHEVSQNPFLVADGIKVNPDAVSADELGALAWQVMEPRYLARLASLGEEFEKARSRGAGSDDLEKVAEASVHGRVAALLIEADREIAGALDGATGKVSFTPLGDPGVDDLLDDLGELVVRKGGSLLVIPADRMPTTTGLAATYRY